jgi:hypothetical protein
MKTSILLASVAALALCAGSASAAGHHPAAQAKSSHSAAKFKNADRTATVLYDQNDDSQGYADISQNFESTFDVYDSQGSDDFTVPEGAKWSIKEVDVTGLYFNGTGLADSVNVYFYKDKNGHPGKLVASAEGIDAGDDGFGNFAISLPKKSATLKSGHYWVSVQVNMSFSTGQGEWGWATRTTQAGDPAQWQDPGDGFGTGCTSWSEEQTCLGGVGGIDHMFTLRGKSK